MMEELAAEKLFQNQRCCKKMQNSDDLREQILASVEFFEYVARDDDFLRYSLIIILGLLLNPLPHESIVSSGAYPDLFESTCWNVSHKCTVSNRSIECG